MARRQVSDAVAVGRKKLAAIMIEPIRVQRIVDSRGNSAQIIQDLEAAGIRLICRR